MKVFTVGLDQKSPRDDDSVSTVTTEKNGPPPSYVSNSIPASYQQPAIIVQRKSRGYKGILLIMLTVFLIALFALTISEITYNRQRDENFFKLRWAELKHRMSYKNDAGPFNIFHRGLFNPQPVQPISNEIYLSPEKAQSINSAPQIVSSVMQDKEETTTPGKPIDPAPKNDTSSDESSSSSKSVEVEPENRLQSSENPFQDTRLNFLRKILQKIKKHAEQMGFDGTMQISVIEVKPTEDSEMPNPDERFQQRLIPIQPNLFPHSLQLQQQRWGENRFGEFPFRPLFQQNNDIVQRQRPFNLLLPPPMMPNFEVNWPRIEFPRQSSPQMMQNQQFEFPQALPRPFWNNDMYRQQQEQQPQEQQPQNNQIQENERGEIDGHRIGDLLRGILAKRIQNFQQMTNPLLQQQQQQQQQQQVLPASNQIPSPQSQRTIGINLQNDFFPPPSDQSNEDKKVSDSDSKSKDNVISGEIVSEPSKASTWFISKNKDENKQDLAPIENSKPIENIADNMKKIDVVDSWPAPKNDEKNVQVNKEATQPSGLERTKNFPNSAPFFFQVDDPNQAQEEPQIMTK